jgi:hypothetical protein
MTKHQRLHTRDAADLENFEALLAQRMERMDYLSPS